jgi:hypothetical protein
MMEEYIPENNPFVLFLLIVLTGTLYTLWWQARTSRVFKEDPVVNVVLTIFTLGIWGIFLNFRYLQKSELLNGREMKWYVVLFLPFSPVLYPIIIQSNINEKYFPGR